MTHQLHLNKKVIARERKVLIWMMILDRLNAIELAEHKSRRQQISLVARKNYLVGQNINCVSHH